MYLIQFFLKNFFRIAGLGTVLALSLSLSLSQVYFNTFFIFSQKMPGIHFMWIYRLFYFVGGQYTQGGIL
jgi:hypothetical protein